MKTSEGYCEEQYPERRRGKGKITYFNRDFSGINRSFVRGQIFI